MAPTRPLSELAGDAGYTAADLAFLSGLTESTLSRLWNDPNWLDRATGRSLQAIGSVMPGVWSYARQASTVTRLMGLASDLAENNVQVDTGALQTAITQKGIHEQYIANALQLADYILDGDKTSAAKHLTRFWGVDQDAALSTIFDQGPDKLIDNPSVLIDAASGMADSLKEKTSSFHAFMGYTTIVHHVAKSTGHLLTEKIDSNDRHEAMLERSGTIGMIIATDDVELVDHYATRLENSTVTGLIEDWALPAYTRDASASNNFYLPKNTSLARSINEVIKQVRLFNDAYVYYLAKVYIPRAMRVDRRLGGRRNDLVEALSERRRTSSEKTRNQLETLLKNLQKEIS